jgi:hypothetical protein
LINIQHHESRTAVGRVAGVTSSIVFGVGVGDMMDIKEAIKRGRWKEKET